MLSFQESILIFAAIILACGSGGLLAVRLSNRLLKGLGWLGGSFAAAGGGAILFLLDDRIPALWGTAIADLLVLFSFVLIHVAILELVESDSLFPTFGASLLAIQAVLGLITIYGHGIATIRISLMGFMIAAQTGQTAVRLFREGKRAIRVPAWFCAVILTGFTVLNVLRAAAVALGLQNHPHAFSLVEAATFALYIAVALGIAFAFFWMTTTMLSTGLEHIASTDPLTRLYNRRVFLMWCERELSRSQRNGNPFSVLMIDLDHFKQINDTFGHQTGDLALCTAVERMQDSIRGIDVLGRWGGEEFAAVLPNASLDAAFVVAERVRANVESILLPAQTIREERKIPMIRLTVSVGVATYSGPDDSIQAMLHRADASLYQAKAAGRNRVLAYAEQPASQLSLIGV